MGVVAAKVFY